MLAQRLSHGHTMLKIKVVNYEKEEKYSISDSFFAFSDRNYGKRNI